MAEVATVEAVTAAVARVEERAVAEMVAAAMEVAVMAVEKEAEVMAGR